ncbi:MAG: hypothetical protein ABFS86_08430 [Planctomycetota bacterium]
MRFLLALLFLLPLSVAAGKESKEEKKTSPDLSAVKAAFQGKVVSFKARRITLEYDFAKKECLADFLTANPFRDSARGGFRHDEKLGVLAGEGVGAFAHKGVFEADVELKFSMTSRTPNDVGAVLLDGGGSDQFLLFSLADTYFCKKDRQTPRQHMITMVGADDSGAARDETLFRYLSRSTKPTLKAGKKIDVEVRKFGPNNLFKFAGKKMTAADRYGKLESVQPAFFVLNSSLRVTKLSISGKLTEKWLKRKRIPWDPEEVDDAKPGEIKVDKSKQEPDRGGRGRRGGRGGSRSVEGRVDRVMDGAELTEKERERVKPLLTDYGNDAVAAARDGDHKRLQDLKNDLEKKLRKVVSGRKAKKIMNEVNKQFGSRRGWGR